MKQMLDLVRFLDEGRWSFGGNYDIPNYADKNLPLDQKWLTHFLGYITDRQTKYELIFSKLDFIFSQLVADYQHSTPYYLLFEPGPFFKNEKFTAPRLFDDHAQYAEDKLFPHSENITAASRFFPVDFAAIFCTLELLCHFSKKSLSHYMKLFLEKADEGRELESLLYGLWLLGYSNLGQWKRSQLEHQAILERCIVPKREAVENYLSKNGGIPAQFRKERYKIKRLTCFVRDLLKCDNFIDKAGELLALNVSAKLREQLHVLELPGDVWNNNEHFQKCFCIHSEMEYKKSAGFNKKVRKLYENHAWQELGLAQSDYYPEQFDTTFDFVPRMCEKIGQTNCRYCPLRENSDGKIPKEFCLQTTTDDDRKFCPFLLYACGYKAICKDMKTCPNKPKNQ